MLFFAGDEKGSGEFFRQFYFLFFYFSRYLVTVTVTLNGISKTSNCTVTVDKDVIVRPIIPAVDALLLPVEAGKRVEIATIVDHLVPRCYCEWTVVNDEANTTTYAFFNVSEIVRSRVWCECDVWVCELIPNRSESFRIIAQRSRQSLRLRQTRQFPLRTGRLRQRDHHA